MITMRSFVRGAAVVALSFLVTGCEAPAPTGVADRGPETVRVNGVNLVVVPGGLRVASAMVMKEIGPDGGAIEVDGGRLEVPAGALAEAVTISMKGRETDQYKYRFGPNGLVFDTAAALSIVVDPLALGVDPERLAIAGASAEEDDWTVIGGAYDEATGTVVAPIEHFSSFALCLE